MSRASPPRQHRWLAVAAIAWAASATGAQAQSGPAPMSHEGHAGHQMAAPDAQKSMSRADMDAMVKAHFAEADSNKDGFVTQAEMQAMRASHMKAMADGMFARIDSNGDGQISRAEFDAHHAARMSQSGGKGEMMPPPPPGAMMPEKMGGHEGGMGSMGAKAFTQADSNKDGKLSLAEVQAVQSARFAKLDANKDGVVTAEERKAMHKAHRQARRAAGK